MSASEIIEQIKRLPPEEARLVRDFVNSPNFERALAVKYVPDEEFQRVAKEVFTKYDTLFRKLAEYEAANPPK